MIDDNMCALQQPTDEIGKKYVMFANGNGVRINESTDDEIFSSSLFEVGEVIIPKTQCQVNDADWS